MLIFPLVTLSRTFAHGEIKQINVKGKTRVYAEGSGEQTIVLLSGWGTENPIDDFKTLIDKLSFDFRVVALEYFGYGSSDVTFDERSNKEMVEEIRRTLQELHIKPSYVLMRHSMSGLYALCYTHAYRDKVVSIIGIDASLQQGTLLFLFVEVHVWIKNINLCRSDLILQHRLRRKTFC